MKTKITLTLVALFAFTFAQGQEREEITGSQVEDEMNTARGITFDPGDMFVEGGISFSTNDNSDAYSINPKFGYFTSRNFAVGADIDFGGSKDDITDVKSDFFGIGAFGRYYFLELSQKRFKAYGEVGLGYSHSRDQGPTFDDTTNGIKANITLGINYFFTKNFAATFVLADILTYNNAQPEDGSSSNSFELNINLFNNIFAQPKFGLLYKFN